MSEPSGSGSAAASSVHQEQEQLHTQPKQEAEQQAQSRRKPARDRDHPHQHAPKPTRVPFFASGAQPEIVRANQKDLYYLSQLSERFEDVARSLLGTRWLQKWGKELEQGSKFAYFGLTTLLGSQTLGEEYCDIMQYSVGTRKPPSKRRRAFLLASHILFPYLLARSYATFRRSLIIRSESLERTRQESISLSDSLFTSSQSPPTSPPITTKDFRDKVLDKLSEYAQEAPSFETLTEDYLRSVHLAIFYLWGRYYNLSKRLAGIRFISTQARRSLTTPSATSPPSSYEVLGVLMAVQITVRTLLAIRRYRNSLSSTSTATATSPSTEPTKEKASTQEGNGKKRPFLIDGQPVSKFVFDPDDPEQSSPYPDEEEGGGGGGADSRERRCPLCLGTRRDPTATECGHVFCWECIVGWAREKPECPLCRQSIQMSKLLPVYNL